MNKKEGGLQECPSRLPTHPGAILKEDVLPYLGLSVSAAARELGVTAYYTLKVGIDYAKGWAGVADESGQ